MRANLSLLWAFGGAGFLSPPGYSRPARAHLIPAMPCHSGAHFISKVSHGRSRHPHPDPPPACFRDDGPSARRAFGMNAADIVERSAALCMSLWAMPDSASAARTSRRGRCWQHIDGGWKISTTGGAANGRRPASGGSFAGNGSRGPLRVAMRAQVRGAKGVGSLQRLCTLHPSAARLPGGQARGKQPCGKCSGLFRCATHGFAGRGGTQPVRRDHAAGPSRAYRRRGREEARLPPGLNLPKLFAPRGVRIRCGPRYSWTGRLPLRTLRTLVRTP
ncbi:hypothetical protein C7405_1301 [Paraburkholderia caballeronis]|nr:hypothetical protein C7405_1301 [Paraburkholderia caballeronis]